MNFLKKTKNYLKIFFLQFEIFKLEPRLNRIKSLSLYSFYMGIFLLGLTLMATSRGHEMTISKTITFLVSIVIFISAVINITFLSIRRLHDCNLSGWWYLLFIIPTLGDALRIVACCFPGTNGNNRFGNQPSSAPKFYYLLILTTPLVFIILAYTGLLDTLINFLGI